LVRYRFLY